MSVSELIKQLENYDPNAEIIINPMNIICEHDECSLHVDGDCDKTIFFNIESINHNPEMPIE